MESVIFSLVLLFAPWKIMMPSVFLQYICFHLSHNKNEVSNGQNPKCLVRSKELLLHIVSFITGWNNLTAIEKVLTTNKLYIQH